MTDPTSLLLDDDRSLADLATYLRRALRADPDGVARLVAAPGPGGATVLAVYVCPVHGGGGPTVLGLRTYGCRPDGAGPGDVVVPLAALADRLARLERAGRAPGAGLPLPPAETGGPAWVGVSPPRDGWTEAGSVSARELTEVAHRGITEIASGAPDVAGAAAVAMLRGRVWGRPVGTGPAVVPAGTAFVAQALGFLRPDDAAEPRVVVRARGAWRRLTLPGGHVIARTALI